MRTIILILVSFVCMQSDCITNSELKDNFYSSGKRILKGVELGNLRFNLSIEDINQNFIILNVSSLESGSQQTPLVGASANKVCNSNKMKDIFIVKRSLGISDERGNIKISKNEKNVSYFSISYPGFTTRIFKYEDFIDCKK